MGKRSNFERIHRDLYPTTDRDAVRPLIPHITDIRFYHEPCVGAGDLVRHLEAFGKYCTGEGDIAQGIDALSLRICLGQAFISNPPWTREILHRLIAHLSAIAPTWLLFDADWMHTVQSSQLQAWCRKIVSVGRVCWFPETKQTGKENCAWYLFDQHTVGQTIFVGPIIDGGSI